MRRLAVQSIRTTKPVALTCLVWLPESEVGAYGQFSGHQRDDEDYYAEEPAEFDIISEDEVDDLEDDELRQEQYDKHRHVPAVVRLRLRKRSSVRGPRRHV